jgi:ParB-like chromosome segregation protein Spo0J
MEDPETIAHVEWLSQSIEHEGVKNPLKVFSEGEHVFVANGHCRLAATMLAIGRGADIASVPCIVEPKGTNDVDRKLDQILDNAGKPLSPLEAGENIKYAVAKGWSVDQIAKKLGRSTTYVYSALDLQGAPAAVHEAVRMGSISATSAAGIVRAVGADAAPAVVRQAVATAKAAGKTKATAATIRPLVPHKTRADPEIVSFMLGDVVVHKPGSSISQELNVTIKGVIHNAHRSVWEEVANRILDMLEGKTAA